MGPALRQNRKILQDNIVLIKNPHGGAHVKSTKVRTVYKKYILLLVYKTEFFIRGTQKFKNTLLSIKNKTENLNL